MALDRLLRSPLAERFDFRILHQESAAGGLDVALLRRFVGEIRGHAPAMVHVRGLGNEGFHGVLAARLAGVRRVLVSVHGTQRDLVAVPSPARRAVVTRVLEPATLRMAGSVTTVCAAAARRPFLDPVRGKVLGVVPNGVPLPDLRDRARVRADVRAELGIPAGDVVVLSAARLAEDKGLGDLARAAALLGPEPAWRLVVAGSGPDEARLRAAFEAAPYVPVHWLGTRSDVDRLMLAADVFVLPSWSENMSNALLEAMAAGLPVLASSVGGSPEAVGSAGVLVAPQDPAALATQLARLLAADGERQRVGAAARARAEQHYTVDHMSRRLGEIYDEILERT
ncbi:glycosyltransferase [Blastococcus capsensis]|uniref:glycosyltransferase n=1 Tax=Blastococcus capsensis TaxID=1564163 RepID=UPI0025411765|nr:glycosyltransferase [Blastococcus capsensis]MDK3257130.1 glycosyltransferase [Blastococcus capsensis]